MPTLCQVAVNKQPLGTGTFRPIRVKDLFRKLRILFWAGFWQSRKGIRVNIDKDHLYYGAACLQVAEDDRYTSINQFRSNNRRVRCTYVVNNDIGLYLTYRGERSRRAKWDGDRTADEYLFTFDAGEIAKIDELCSRYPNTYLGLVCVQNERICCLSNRELRELIALRRADAGVQEDSYVIVVAIFPGTRMSMKVFVTPLGKRNRYLGKPLIVAECAFPSKIFVTT